MQSKRRLVIIRCNWNYLCIDNQNHKPVIWTGAFHEKKKNVASSHRVKPQVFSSIKAWQNVIDFVRCESYTSSISMKDNTRICLLSFICARVKLCFDFIVLVWGSESINARLSHSVDQIVIHEQVLLNYMFFTFSCLSTFRSIGQLSESDN